MALAPTLIYLDIGGYHQRRDLSPLSALTGLISLGLPDSPDVENLSALLTLTNLRELDLKGSPQEALAAAAAEAPEGAGPPRVDLTSLRAGCAALQLLNLAGQMDLFGGSKSMQMVPVKGVPGRLRVELGRYDLSPLEGWPGLLVCLYESLVACWDEGSGYWMVCEENMVSWDASVKTVSCLTGLRYPSIDPAGVDIFL